MFILIVYHSGVWYGGEKEMNYTFKKNKRTKGLTLSVRIDGSVLITARRAVRAEVLERFVAEKQEWIEKTRARMRARVLDGIPLLARTHSPKELKQYKARAMVLAQQHLMYFNAFYAHTYGKITIRNQSTRWGSCARSGALSFNYRLALLPPRLAEYIVVHELCHLKQMNHSLAFWKLVAQTIPDHRARRAELRKL